jgi:hypothetical protein
MKKYLGVSYLIILLNLFSCETTAHKTKADIDEIQVEVNKQDSILKDSAISIKKSVLPKYYEHLYVSARSGLNYRDSPKGKIIGKYPLNTRLKVIEHTQIIDQIQDGGNTIKGEWLGIEKDMDTVYVFNRFLSQSFIYSELKIYRTSGLDNKERKIKFINLSESYFNNEYSESLILLESNLKDRIRLNSEQRKKFLDRINVSELDSVFIYDVNSGIISTYKIKNLTAIACINIYFDNREDEKNERAFQFGFDLGNSYSGGLQNFTYIGKNNPFQKGKLKPIIWKEINTQEFPKKFNPNIIGDFRKKWFNGFESKESFKFSNNNLNYFIQNLKVDDRLHRYIIVIDSKREKIIYENVQISSEDSDLRNLAIENKKKKYKNGPQWTGKLFKNKPSVMFGFFNHTFSCPSITILDETEPFVRILCDCRH